MYDTLTKNLRGERQDFNIWNQGWTTTDKSEASQRQENGYDCRIFTLISMSLLRNGHRLRRNSYVQESLYCRNSRKKLAWAIWKSGLGSNVTRWQPGTHQHTTAATDTGGTTNKQPKGIQQWEKRWKEGKLIPGGSQMQSLIKWYGNDQADKDKGRGQKRNAKSEAKEEGGKGIATCRKQPPRKRGRMESRP